MALPARFRHTRFLVLALVIVLLTAAPAGIYLVGRPALQRTRPIIEDLRDLVGEARPLASNLAELTTSLRDSGGIERLMDYLFFQVGAINGYDTLGHYLRAGLIVNTCTTYTATPQPGCSARFRQRDSSAARASAASADNVNRLRPALTVIRSALTEHSSVAPSGNARQMSCSFRPGTVISPVSPAPYAAVTLRSR